MSTEKTYRLSSIVTSTSLPIYGPEGEPIRLLIDNDTDREVCAVRDDAGPESVGVLTVEQVLARYAEPMDDGDGDYYECEMRSALSR